MVAEPEQLDSLFLLSPTCCRVDAHWQSSEIMVMHLNYSWLNSISKEVVWGLGTMGHTCLHDRCVILGYICCFVTGKCAAHQWLFVALCGFLQGSGKCDVEEQSSRRLVQSQRHRLVQSDSYITAFITSGLQYSSETSSCTDVLNVHLYK